MTNLTIRMDSQEKDRLAAWAAVKGVSVTAYIKGLISADMAASTPQERAEAWIRENQAAISTEAEHIRSAGIPGSHLALNNPWPDE